ncbi:MAG TPA: hypothetical protein VGC42_23865, partial [Kofleriaceae bacterium]
FLDSASAMIPTRFGAVASRRIEDALYDAGAALCVAGGRPDPDDPGHELPVAAIQLPAGAVPDLVGLSRAVVGLPEYARPRRLYLATSIPVTDGYRPLKRALAAADLTDAARVLVWDTLTQRYTATS